jgi:protein tyrosine phosphatase (PTP) superfamily phosphohydrolase (DUF442 family)
MTTMLRSRRITRLIVRTAAAIMLALLFGVAWNQANHNFGVVQPERVYRAGQMPGSALAQTLRERRIKTVLNLRGSNPSEPWYRDEISTTREACVTHVDIAMSSCLWMSRVQLRALVKTLDTAERPLLIHCAWGSERTGLASAFVALLRPGGTLDDARAQFSIRHLFVRVNDGKVMAEHLDQYENWLRERGIEHQPANFHRWVDEGFKPGQPSREDWPYDPYPLVIVVRPGDKPGQQPIAERAGSHSRRR